MSRKFNAPVVLFAVAALGLASCPTAYATPVVLDFNCAGTDLNGASPCPAVATRITTNFKENGFVVTPKTTTSWDWGPLDGNPAPDIKTGKEYSASGNNIIKVAMTNNGLFEFNSVQLNSADTSAETYAIEGFVTGNSNPVFDIDCGVSNDSICKTNTTWLTISNSMTTDGHGFTVTGNPTGEVNYLDIILVDPTAGSITSGIDRLDNLADTPDLSAVPEPGSLLLLGTGLFGLGALLLTRRRASVKLYA